LLTSVKLQPVFFGGGIDPVIAPNLANFYNILSSSFYSRWVFAEYQAGVQLIPQPATTALPLAQPNVTDSNIQNFLKNQFGDNGSNFETLYIVHLPPGASVTDAGPTCGTNSKACGYHNVTGNLHYAVIGSSSCAPGCAGGVTGFQAVSMVESHEIMEAITDADGQSGWTDPNQPSSCDPGGAAEIGDICNAEPATITTSAGTATVTNLWSNLLNACVSEDFGIPNGPAAGAGIGAANRTYGTAEVVVVSADGTVNEVHNADSNVEALGGITGSWIRFVPLTGPGFALPGSPVTIAQQNYSPALGTVPFNVALVAGTNGAIDAFVPESGNPWTQLPSPPAGVPLGAHIAAAQHTHVDGTPELDVFYVDKGGTVQVQSVVGTGAWSNPTPISAANANQAGSQVAAIDTNGTQYAFWFQRIPFKRTYRTWLYMNHRAFGGPWGSPTFLGSQVLPGGPLAVTVQRVDDQGDSQVDVFTADGLENLQETTIDGGGTARWAGYLGGKVGFPSNVLPFQQVTNSINLAYVDPNGAVQLRTVQQGSNGAWSPAIALTGPGFAPPGAPLAAAQEMPAGENNPSRTDLFVVANTPGKPGAVYVISALDTYDEVLTGSWSAPVAVFPPLFPDGD
jgi:hypothetical protein